jgi:nucleotide-binding universal stress UspA family protein
VRIVAGYDGSDAAKRALRFAAELAPGSRITVASVVPALRFGLTDPVWAEEQEGLLAEASEILGEKAEVDVVGPVGDAAQALVAVAKDVNADLLVLGTEGRGAVGRLVVGSVSSAVARQAPCDVLVVP